MRVQPFASGADEDEGEDWGQWDFVSLPRTGDRIDLVRTDAIELLTVRRVIHFAVQHPLPRTETPFRQRQAASICIVAARLP